MEIDANWVSCENTVANVMQCDIGVEFERESFINTKYIKYKDRLVTKKVNVSSLYVSKDTKHETTAVTRSPDPKLMSRMYIHIDGLTACKISRADEDILTCR